MTIVLALLAGFAATAQEAQAKSCGIELSVTRPNGRPLLSVPATIINLTTKKSSKAGFFEGYPVFSNLREGRYKITVMAPGYKTTVRQINLNCRLADADQNSVIIDITLQRGSRKQIYNQADSGIKPVMDLTMATSPKFKEI